MRSALIVVAAILLLAGALALLAPASLVAPVVARATQGRLTLAGAEGTIWRGRATLAGADGAVVPLAWSAAPSLAFGTLQLRLSPAAQGSPRGDLTLERDAVRARNVAASVPAAWLAPAQAPVSLGGEVDITTDSLDWTPPESRGEARVVWRKARIALNGAAPVDLGEVRATLAASGERIGGPVANEGGDVTLAGEVAAFANGDGEVNLLVTPRRADEAVMRLLASIGSPEGGGYRLLARWPAR